MTTRLRYVYVLLTLALIGCGVLVSAQTAPTLDERMAAAETRIALHDTLLGLVPTGTPQAATATLVPVAATATSVAATATTIGATATSIAATATTVGATSTAIVATLTAVIATAPPTPLPATQTAVIPPTNTPVPVPTVVPPTATPIPPTSTPAGLTPTAAPPTASPVPVAGAECPLWVHDRYTTVGPDGRTYPTWHPQVDPEYSCRMPHEHGQDPRTSLANPTMPAFGYIGQLAGDNEPIAGFKVFVQNRGQVNEDGRTLAHHARLVVHQGTSGPARFVVRFHSMQYDFVAGDGSGHEAHIMGMADTGTASSSICSPRLPKTVMTIPGLCATTSPYEIWTTVLSVGRFTTNTAWGVFDPITIMDPADPTRLLLMSTFYPQYGSNPLGCKREGYSGPNYWRNGSGGGLSTFRTDAYGVEMANGPILQTVSRHSDLGVPAYQPKAGDPAQSQAKLASHHCAPGLRSPN